MVLKRTTDWSSRAGEERVLLFGEHFHRSGVAVKRANHLAVLPGAHLATQSSLQEPVAVVQQTQHQRIAARRRGILRLFCFRIQNHHFLFATDVQQLAHKLQRHNGAVSRWEHFGNGSMKSAI
jgi:hypothetical protein